MNPQVLDSELVFRHALPGDLKSNGKLTSATFKTGGPVSVDRQGGRSSACALHDFATLHASKIVAEICAKIVRRVCSGKTNARDRTCCDIEWDQRPENDYHSALIGEPNDPDDNFDSNLRRYKLTDSQARQIIDELTLHMPSGASQIRLPF